MKRKPDEYYEQAAISLSHENGRELQRRPKGSKQRWAKLPPALDFKNYEYRLLPKS